MKKTIFIILCWMTLYGWSQKLPDLSPPSPEVAAMGKYLDIPVNLHAGIPNISIPLTRITDSDLGTSVSLSYHGSGIKVSEIASRVGLGWRLHAGGMITRQVRGIADDAPDGFINTSNTISHFFNQDQNERARLFQLATQGTLDYESDIYYFNVEGLQGKFFFDQNGTIVMHQKSDVKIVALRNGNSISGWQVTTARGIIYRFGVIEGTTQTIEEVKETRFHVSSSNLPGKISRHTTGWYLTQISDFKGNKIVFNYQQPSSTITYWSVTGQSKNLTGQGQNCTTGSNHPISLSEDIYTPTYISSITTKEGSIVFEYNHNRTDLKNDKALTKIKLLDKNNLLIDQYRLNYGYFIAPQGLENLLNYGNQDQRTHRLYLKEITQEKGTIKNKIHQFTYNQEHQLPERFSFSQDLWGYYNGATNNVLYPSIVYTPYTTPVEVEGAERTVSLPHTKALSLQQITYPTKGKTTFIFESNTMAGNKDFFVGTKTKAIAIPEGNLSMQDNINSPNKVTTHFTLDQRTLVYANVDVANECDRNAADCPKINLYAADGTLVSPILKTVSKSNILLDLAPGRYTVEMSYLIPSNNSINISFYKKEFINTGDTPVAIAGGLRVKEIHFMEPDNQIITTKKYLYHEFDNVNKSSGRSLNPPVFLSKRIPYNGCTQDVVSSNAIFPLNGQSGSHVSYLNVTELTRGKENGKTEYTYSYAADGAINATNVFDQTVRLVVPALDYSHRRGQLLVQKYYRYEQSTDKFIPIKEIKQHYLATDYIRTKNLMMGRVGDLNEMESYDNLSERYVLSQTKQKDFYWLPEVAQMETTKTYKYDSGYNGRTFPTQITSTTSQGETIVEKNFYADDITSATALTIPFTTEAYQSINRLKKNFQHRIAEPIQQEVWIGNKKNSTTRTNYAMQQGIPLPKSIQTAKGTSSLNQRITYISYDDYGNPLEVKQTNGVHMLYIWGYDHTYPIAEIVNASYTGMPDELTQLISQLKIASDNENSVAEENTIRDLFSQLRAHPYFSKATIAGYTYDPLIGVTSKTDSRGRTTYYEYDDFNRLKTVRDHQKKLISENTYNYKNN